MQYIRVFRYFIDVTNTTNVNMDKEWSHIKNKHSDGIFTFGASFTVSVLVINILPFTLNKNLWVT